jgi:hypothetical protein
VKHLVRKAKGAKNTIPLVSANSFRSGGYFVETNLASIRVGDPAAIKPKGHNELVRGMSAPSPARSTLRMLSRAKPIST